VDSLECNISQEPAQEVVGDVTLRFHHVRITVAPDGKWWAVNEHTEEYIGEGAIEPVTNDGWRFVQRG